MADNITPDSKQDFARQSRRIWMVGGALALGAAINVGIFNLLKSTASHITLCLLVATIQISLQLFVFMHLKKEASFILKVMLVTLVLVAALIFLNILAHANPLHSPYISL